MKWYKLLIISMAIFIFGMIALNNIMLVMRPEGAFPLDDYTLWYGKSVGYGYGLIGIIIGAWIMWGYNKLSQNSTKENKNGK